MKNIVFDTRDCLIDVINNASELTKGFREEHVNSDAISHSLSKVYDIVNDIVLKVYTCSKKNNII